MTPRRKRPIQVLVIWALLLGVFLFATPSKTNLSLQISSSIVQPAFQLQQLQDDNSTITPEPIVVEEFCPVAQVNITWDERCDYVRNTSTCASNPYLVMQFCAFSQLQP